MVILSKIEEQNSLSIIYSIGSMITVLDTACGIDLVVLVVSVFVSSFVVVDLRVRR